MSFGFAPFAAASFAATGEPGVRAVVNLTGVSLTATVSNSYTVQKTHFVSGLNLTSNTGTLTTKLAPTIASNAVTSAVTSIVPSTGHTIQLTSNAVTSAVGSVTATVIANVTGNIFEAEVGTATASGSAVSAVTGTSSTLSAGTVSPAADANITVTGTSSTINLGSVEEQLTKNISGVSLTSAVGTVVPSTGHTIAVAGTSSTLSVGTPSYLLRIHEAITGLQVNSSVGTVTPSTGSTLVTQGNLANTSVGPSDQTFAITVAVSGGINVFYVDGVARPALELIKGKTYTFDQSNNTNGGHPLVFVTSGGSSYTSGVTVTGTAGQPGAKVTFVVPQDAPYGLAYLCSVHGAGMGNFAYVSPLATIALKPSVVGQSLSTSVNSVSITLSPVAAVTGELIPITVNPLSVFTWSKVDDTTTGGATWTEVDSTTGAGGSSWQEVA